MPGGGRDDYEWRDVVMPGIGLYRVQAARTGELAGIHERMPVVVAPAMRDAWLDAEEEGEAVLEAVLAEAPEVAAGLRMHVVDRRVGNVREQGPGLVEPVA